MALKKVLSLHENLPSIIRESMRPMERIDGMPVIGSGHSWVTFERSNKHSQSSEYSKRSP